MDGRRFDEIASELAHGASRRAVVKDLAGGGLAALLAALGLGGEEAAAASGGATTGGTGRRSAPAGRPSSPA